MELWNGKGLKTPLSRGAKPPAKREPSETVFRMGQVPLISRAVVGLRIRHREGAIGRLGRRVRRLADLERSRVEKVIAAAEKTDIHSVINRARALQDKLEDAVCAKVKFPEAEDEEDDRRPGRPKKVKKEMTLEQKCLKAVAIALGRSPIGRWKPEDRKLIDDCVRQGGKISIPTPAGPTVDIDASKAVDEEEEKDD